MGRLGKFAVVAVLGAALFAASPLIGPMLASAPAAFSDLLASAADVGSSDTSASSDVIGPAAGEPAAGAEGSDAVSSGTEVPARPEGATAMTVDYVHDGDTLFLVPAGAASTTSSSDRVKVRLIGLDTPEIGDAAECFGAEATEQLRTLLPVGSQTWVTSDIEPTDQYGRSLFYLWTEDGRFVNYELVAGGAAEELTYAPNDAYLDLILSAEATAQSSGAGRWGSC